MRTPLLGLSLHLPEQKGSSHAFWAKMQAAFLVGELRMETQPERNIDKKQTIIYNIIEEKLVLLNVTLFLTMTFNKDVYWLNNN